MLSSAQSIENIFESSNAVLVMAFTPPPLEKVIVIAFCTAETNFVLHSKQKKTKIESCLIIVRKLKFQFRKVIPNLKKGGKKLSSNICFCLFAFAQNMLLNTCACFCMLLQTFAGFCILLQAFAYFFRLYIFVQAFVYFSRLLHDFAGFCLLVQAFVYFSRLLRDFA